MTALEERLESRSRGGAVPRMAREWDAELAGMLEASSEGAVRIDAEGAAGRLARILEAGSPAEANGALDYVEGAMAEAVGRIGDAYVMGPMIHRLVMDVYALPRHRGRLAPFLKRAYSKSIRTHDLRADVMIEAVRAVLICMYADSRFDGERASLALACYETLARIADGEGPARLARLLSRSATREAVLAPGPVMERLIRIYHMVSEKHESVRRGDIGELLSPYPNVASYVGVRKAGRALALLPPLATHLSVLSTANRLEDSRHELGGDEEWADWRADCETRFVACEGKNPLLPLNDMIGRRERKVPQDERWGAALLTESFDQAAAEMSAWVALGGIGGARLEALGDATDTLRVDTGSARCAIAIHAASNHLPFLGDTLYSTISPITQRHNDCVARRIRVEVLSAAARARAARRDGELAIVIVDDSLGSAGELGAAESAMRQRGAPDAVIVMRGGSCRHHAAGARAREAAEFCGGFAAALAEASGA